MLVSWKWLSDYVSLAGLEPDAVAQRLAMAGLNHEASHAVGDDTALDLEVTSNRPDWLGHIGVAREVAVLHERELTVADPQPAATGPDVATLAQVRVEAPELCGRYIARVIQGVRIGPSPAWLVERLATIGVKPVNNVVDITNYVLFECGQPLHAFDLARLAERTIVVRRARAGEKLEAIDHREYPLGDDLCVIADAQRPVAIGGVMGGAATEVGPQTVDLLIESAEFDPLAIRTAARRLHLHSPSSYRFERGVDRVGVDWASRRCCQLILEIAGGKLATGAIDVGPPPAATAPLQLRWAQIERVLGIAVEPAAAKLILAGLGCTIDAAGETGLTARPPTWRRDLTREIDLIEEVARVYGYDQIPEDAAVPMAPSHRRDEDRVQGIVRRVLTAAGYDEALTASVVPAAWSEALSPWSDAPPLVASTPMLRGADHLRRSLIPSLLEARRINQSLGNAHCDLFETAAVYLSRGGRLPHEERVVAWAGGGDFLAAKGIVESLLAALHVDAPLVVEPCRLPLLDGARTGRLSLGGERLGFIGEVADDGRKQFSLRGAATVAELSLAVLGKAARLIPQYRELSVFPSIEQDFNFVVDEAVRWAELSATVRAAGGELLETLAFGEIYRDADKDGAGKKRMLLSITLRAMDRTLTGDEAEAVRQRILAACGQQHAATLLT